MSRARTWMLTAMALCGFAANSLLCRGALAGPVIDPASFTALRLGAGALALAVLVRGRGAKAAARAGGVSAMALFAYAICFSLAYLVLSAGLGALLLFGAVQATMIGHVLWRGERPRAREWVGLVLALGGVAYLVAPGVTAPEPWGAALMLAAGVAWGVYSLAGRGTVHPLATTAHNFARTLPLAAAALLLAALVSGLSISARGAVLALASGALASGVGYALWYAALRGHSATSAAIVQLAVPLLAAGGGVVLLGEPVTVRLAAAALAILGGVALAVTGSSRPARSR